jgi:hypothetical protein
MRRSIAAFEIVLAGTKRDQSVDSRKNPITLGYSDDEIERTKRSTNEMMKNGTPGVSHRLMCISL